MSLELYPNFPETFSEKVKPYFEFSRDIEEKKKQDESVEKLESEMEKLNSDMRYTAIGQVFEKLDDKIRVSGLKIDSYKIKEMKKQVLDNMKKYV